MAPSKFSDPPPCPLCPTELGRPAALAHSAGFPEAKFRTIQVSPSLCISVHSNSPSSGDVHFVLAEQEFIFHCVRAGSLSAANSVATALRGTEQKRCRKWLVAR